LQKRAELIRVHVRDLGSARATTAAATLPPAPGRFSTTTGTPREAAREFDSVRGTLSIEPPAGCDFETNGFWSRPVRRAGLPLRGAAKAAEQQQRNPPTMAHRRRAGANTAGRLLPITLRSSVLSMHGKRVCCAPAW
jgi:hypothetical protein